jgi:hypothetical protein
MTWQLECWREFLLLSSYSKLVLAVSQECQTHNAQQNSFTSPVRSILFQTQVFTINSKGMMMRFGVVHGTTQPVECRRPVLPLGTIISIPMAPHCSKMYFNKTTLFYRKIVIGIKGNTYINLLSFHAHSSELPSIFLKPNSPQLT